MGEIVDDIALVNADRRLAALDLSPWKYSAMALWSSRFMEHTSIGFQPIPIASNLPIEPRNTLPFSRHISI